MDININKVFYGVLEHALQLEDSKQKIQTTLVKITLGSRYNRPQGFCWKEKNEH